MTFPGRLGGVLEFMASSDFQETADGKMVAMTPKKHGNSAKNTGNMGLKLAKFVIYRYFCLIFTG